MIKKLKIANDGLDEFISGLHAWMDGISKFLESFFKSNKNDFFKYTEDFEVPSGPLYRLQFFDSDEYENFKNKGLKGNSDKLESWTTKIPNKDSNLYKNLIEFGVNYDYGEENFGTLTLIKKDVPKKDRLIYIPYLIDTGILKRWKKFKKEYEVICIKQDIKFSDVIKNISFEEDYKKQIKIKELGDLFQERLDDYISNTGNWYKDWLEKYFNGVDIVVFLDDQKIEIVFDNHVIEIIIEIKEPRYENYLNKSIKDLFYEFNGYISANYRMKWLIKKDSRVIKKGESSELLRDYLENLIKERKIKK